MEFIVRGEGGCGVLRAIRLDRVRGTVLLSADG